MRAVFLEDIIFENEFVSLRDNNFHHLKNVLRVRKGENILLLNGLGVKVRTKIEEIKKKEIILKILSLEEVENKRVVPDIAIGLLKREAFELCIKMAVEIGVQKVFLLHTEYSQRYKINWERVSKILSSAYEQSNRAHKLVISAPEEVGSFNFSKFSHVCVYESFHKGSQNYSASPDLIVIGPEGGFSESEINSFCDLKNIEAIKLKTHILRAPTALSFALGQHYLF